MSRFEHLWSFERPIGWSPCPASSPLSFRVPGDSDNHQGIAVALFAKDQATYGGVARWRSSDLSWSTPRDAQILQAVAGYLEPILASSRLLEAQLTIFTQHCPPVLPPANAPAQLLSSAVTRRSPAPSPSSRPTRRPPPPSPGTSPATTPTPSVVSTSTSSVTTPTAAPPLVPTVRIPTWQKQQTQERCTDFSCDCFSQPLRQDPRCPRG